METFVRLLQVLARGAMFMFLAFIASWLIVKSFTPNALSIQLQGAIVTGCLIAGWVAFRLWYRQIKW
jgi:hypothetical protein